MNPSLSSRGQRKRLRRAHEATLPPTKHVTNAEVRAENARQQEKAQQAWERYQRECAPIWEDAAAGAVFLELAVWLLLIIGVALAVSALVWWVP